MVLFPSFFSLLFLCQICCVIMSCKIPQSVAKLSFKKEDAQNRTEYLL